MSGEENFVSSLLKKLGSVNVFYCCFENLQAEDDITGTSQHDTRNKLRHNATS